MSEAGRARLSCRCLRIGKSSVIFEQSGNIRRLSIVLIRKVIKNIKCTGKCFSTLVEMKSRTQGVIHFEIPNISYKF